MGCGVPGPDYHAVCEQQQFARNGHSEQEHGCRGSCEWCSNRFASAAARTTSSLNDPTQRWLAANELFSNLVARNLLPWYNRIHGGGIVLEITGQRFIGFQVTYSDGWKETWMVTPGYATSGVKLFDTPLPDSLTQGGSNQARGSVCK